MVKSSKNIVKTKKLVTSKDVKGVSKESKKPKKVPKNEQKFNQLEDAVGSLCTLVNKLLDRISVLEDNDNMLIDSITKLRGTRSTFVSDYEDTTYGSSDAKVGEDNTIGDAMDYVDDNLDIDLVGIGSTQSQTDS